MTNPFCERKIYKFREIQVTEQEPTGMGMGMAAGDQPGRWGRARGFLGEVVRWVGHSLAEPLRWILGKGVIVQGALVAAFVSPMVARHIFGTGSMGWWLGLAVQFLVTILVMVGCTAGAIFLRARRQPGGG